MPLRRKRGGRRLKKWVRFLNGKDPPARDIPSEFLGTLVGIMDLSGALSIFRPVALK